MSPESVKYQKGKYLAGDSTKFVVTINTSRPRILCTCLQPQEFGYPCRHCCWVLEYLKILRANFAWFLVPKRTLAAVLEVYEGHVNIPDVNKLKPDGTIMNDIKVRTGRKKTKREKSKGEDNLSSFRTIEKPTKPMAKKLKQEKPAKPAKPAKTSKASKSSERYKSDKPKVAKGTRKTGVAKKARVRKKGRSKLRKVHRKWPRSKVSTWPLSQSIS